MPEARVRYQRMSLTPLVHHLEERATRMEGKSCVSSGEAAPEACGPRIGVAAQ